MSYPEPTPATEVIVLLCAPLSSKSGRTVVPLTLREYNALANWLQERHFHLTDLRHGPALDELADVTNVGLDPLRISALLDRETAYAFILDKWRTLGCWIIGRADPQYPSRLRDRLRAKAPPLLFGIGNHELLSCGGVAVVGSRDADAGALSFAHRFGQACAEDELQVVSGGARGVDTTAASGALEAGGTAIHVLSSGIERDARSTAYRAYLRDSRLALVSPYVPAARFSPGAAMGRNKLIYCLADDAVVVASGTEGGTWQGARENLDKAWVPLYVLNGTDMPDGNARLIEAGATALSPAPFAERPNVHALLTQVVAVRRELEQAEPPAAFHPAFLPATACGGHIPSSPEQETFEFVWPRIASVLHTPNSANELAARLGVRKAQIDDWIKLASEQQLVDLATVGKKKVVILRRSSDDASQMTLPLG